MFNFKNIKSSSSALISQHRKDILIVLLLTWAGGLAYYLGTHFIDPIIFRIQDVWFGDDTRGVFTDMTEVGAGNYRATLHPLFSLMMLLPVYLLKQALSLIELPKVYLLSEVFSLGTFTAVRIVIAVVAALWLSSLFIVLRLIGCSRFDATLFSLLGSASAAAIFWFTIPATYSFSSLSIVLALLFVGLTEYYQFTSLWYVAVSALTLSITTTNWVIGILATAVNHRWKQSLQISVNAFVLVNVLVLITTLWEGQKFIFPSAVFLLGDKEGRDYLDVFRPAGAYLQAIQSFFSHTMVMPAIQQVKNPDYPEWPQMVTQLSPAGSGSWWGNVAVGLWMALLGLGLWGFFSIKKHNKIRLVLGLSLLAQLGIHLIHRDETFLYSLHFAPLLIVLAAFSTLTRARLISLVLAGILTISIGINNSRLFHQIAAYFWENGPPGHLVQAHMRNRPSDPWPRSTGHVILATPGTREEDKAYHEPGGSFSPAVASFGVSIWIVDEQGTLKATSDSIPLNQIHQQFIYPDGQVIPGILTETSDYKATWSAAGVGRWQLNFQPLTNENTQPMIVIRSVGPAGAAIESLNWDNQKLMINNRWSVKLTPAPTAVYLGEEGEQGWMSERGARTVWKGEEGWGYARFELGDGKVWNLTIEDSAFQPKPELSTFQSKPALELDLPERQFSDSLNAQVAHLMMSLVDKQTRPSDPMAVPFPWQRDGAYTLVALARSGQLAVAQELSTYFATKDFFGGFGPEADAPGLAIWALEEVAVRLDDPKYDQWLWPHVQRKAEFILKMLSAKQQIHQPVTAPIWPFMEKNPELTLVADPTQDGLIIGRMDLHRPLLYINAVSYRGLLDAASLAERVNHPADAKRWRIKAAELQKAWIKAFKPPESDNDRTYISSLWQSWIAASHQDSLLQRLQKRWSEIRDDKGAFRQPRLWTYFDVAETHQWLFLGKPEQVWTNLKWFWEHQASPGLYTWWEGGEQGASWQDVRGWVNAPHTTPHYWTASEMLLLQLDMLAYIDQAENESTLVIGAGIPVEWIEQPMSVKKLSMPNNQVDWSWDGRQMNIKIRGKKINVRLGSAFPSNTPVKVNYYNS